MEQMFCCTQYVYDQLHITIAGHPWPGVLLYDNLLVISKLLHDPTSVLEAVDKLYVQLNKHCGACQVERPPFSIFY